VDEGHPAADLRQAGVAPPRLPLGLVQRQAEAKEHAADRAHHSMELAAQQQRHDHLAAGQAHHPQQRADLPAQTAARHQHQPLTALRVLVGELQGHPAAEGVADDAGPLHAEGDHEVPDAAGVGAERVVTPGLGRVAVAEQVGGDDGVMAGQDGHRLPPGGGAAAEAVHEHDRRAPSAHPVAHLVAVQVDVPEPELAPVGCRCRRPGRPTEGHRTSSSGCRSTILSDPAPRSRWVFASVHFRSDHHADVGVTPRRVPARVRRR
jgi:hypothetical protein